MNYKKIAIYIGFFLVLTLAFWYFLFAGTDNWRKKPGVLTHVKPFVFTNQDGIRFTQQDMMGKVSVVEYFFTTCQGICPTMNSNMKGIYETFKDHRDFMVVAHTCDPDRDSVTRLRHYADSLRINTNQWVLLTGRKDSLYNQARNSYLLDDPKNNFEKIEDQFLHTQFFAVVDKSGRVRGEIYDGLKPKELDKLKETVRFLLDEGSSNPRFANSLFTNNPR